MNGPKFKKEMTNIVEYSLGYLDGIGRGKKEFLKALGADTIDLLKKYVDSSAKVNPQMLHHIYEWSMVGSPNGRLFNIDYSVSNLGLSLLSTFRQSSSVKDGSDTPFYNKAKIMENGIPVTITPKESGVLVFEDENGETVFTKSPIYVNAPGGKQVQGSLQDTLNNFFAVYLTQSYLMESGFTMHIGNPSEFKANMSRASRGGKSLGKQIGYNWIVKAGDKL
jgi:hypothetical protein